MKNMILRCYAEGQPGQWEAVCLDFDLAVQGSDFREVIDSLQVAIREYLEIVHELPVEERAHLMERRSPLSMRLKFAWHVLRSIWDGRNGAKGRAEFTLPCPA
ncbi:MAG: hypothetical protein OJJ21_17060 [Ferrovibrio sp.]|uniref:hypothetical protein n=1 Tax=Ferrovibrio sp. TaxID=1917215 RepID=UPI00262828B2|nr:hypothetical protein [Ferrovibrio sp.]MCW0235312.1 hypothetical protein [Ferrovibrio sp.]